MSENIEKTYSYEDFRDETSSFIHDLDNYYIPYSNVRRLISTSASEASLKRQIIDMLIDTEWIDIIEHTIPHLDVAIRNPGRTIEDEEEILPVELSRKISDKSVKHLAQHTNLIMKIEDDKVTPSKILNVYHNETLLTYENKFINTLLNRLLAFVEVRYVALRGRSGISQNISFDFRTNFVDEDTKGTINIKIETNAPLSKSGEETEEQKKANDRFKENFERVEKIYHMLLSYISSDFGRTMGKNFIRPPVIRTNALLKNKDLRECLTLWEYIIGDEKSGVTLINKNFTELPYEDYISEFYDVISLQYQSFYSHFVDKEERGKVYSEDMGQESLPDLNEQLHDDEELFSAYDYERQMMVPITEINKNRRLTPKEKQIQEALRIAILADNHIERDILASEEAAKRSAEAEAQALEMAKRRQDEERKKLEEEALRAYQENIERIRAEEAEKARAEEEARAKAEEEARLKAEEETRAIKEEAERRATEVEAMENARLQARMAVASAAEEIAKREAEKRNAEEQDRIAQENIRRKEEKAAREKAEQEERRKQLEQARIKAAEEARVRAEQEAKERAAEEAKAREAEEKRQAELEKQRKAKEEARLKAEEEARLKAEEEARLKAEEEARLKAEEEERLKAEEEARIKAEEEARRKAEEEARRKAEEEARIKAEEEARRKAEEEARIKAEEEARIKAEEEARIKAEEEARIKAEEEARRKAEEESRIKAEEEARLKAEEEARAKAEEEARIKAEEEARRKAEEEARLKAEEEARIKAEEEARIKAEEEARIKAEEEARIKAEEEARAKAEEEARIKAEEEARIKAEEEARIKAEEEARIEAERTARDLERQAERAKIIRVGEIDINEDEFEKITGYSREKYVALPRKLKKKVAMDLKKHMDEK